MELFDYLLNAILPLPWIVKGPGFAMIAWLLLRSVMQFLTLRWIKSATSIVFALIIALVLARYGTDIAAFLAEKTAENSTAN